MEALKTTATPISEYLLNLLRSNSMIKKETMQLRTAVQSGLSPAARPIATPAKEEWASASPEEERRLNTALDPRRGIATPSRMLTKKAICMNL